VGVLTIVILDGVEELLGLVFGRNLENFGGLE
jgi:hypothetical protein